MINQRMMKLLLDVAVDPPTRVAHMFCNKPSIAILELPVEHGQTIRMCVCTEHRRIYNKIAKRRGLVLVAESHVGGRCQYSVADVTVTTGKEST